MRRRLEVHRGPSASRQGRPAPVQPANMRGVERDEVCAELLAAPEAYRALLASGTAGTLRRRTDGTRWTNREMLFHLLLGYLVVRRLLPLLRLMGRLPPWVWRSYVAVLNASARPFHLVNYLASVIGGRILSVRMMGRIFDGTCAGLAGRLARTGDAALGRPMPFPTRWDPFFTDRMSLLDLYHYPAQHMDFHRRQLTLD
jgi:hypothetical protein